MLDRTSVDATDLDPQDTGAPDARPTGTARRLPPAAVRRPALYLVVAACGALVLSVLTGGEPPAQADAQLQSVSIAEKLGISGDTAAVVTRDEAAGSLKQLAASRSERQSEETAAARKQAAADKAERDRRAAAAAAAKAKAEAAAKAKAEAAAKAKAEAAAKAKAEAAAKAKADAAAKAAQAAKTRAPSAPAPAAAPAAAAAPAGSFQDYALSKLGGDSGQFSCLENLWGKESGWNPNAQNSSSTAYGIPQFLDSTWAGTGIAKTSDGYRQIDAGLIYIDSRYGTPCGAWGHSQSTGWY
jgi:TolA protein